MKKRTSRKRTSRRPARRNPKWPWKSPSGQPLFFDISIDDGGGYQKYGRDQYVGYLLGRVQGATRLAKQAVLAGSRSAAIANLAAASADYGEARAMAELMDEHGRPMSGWCDIEKLMLDLIEHEKNAIARMN